MRRCSKNNLEKYKFDEIFDIKNQIAVIVLNFL
jgi:hypothetical protein